MTHRPWTKDDVADLRVYWRNKHGVAKIAQHLQRSPSSIYQKAFSLGLTRNAPWTLADIRYLQDAWPLGVSTAIIAKRLGRTRAATQKQAETMSLQRPGRHRWTAAELERLHATLDRVILDAAKVLGVTPRAVCTRIAQYAIVWDRERLSEISAIRAARFFGAAA